MSVKQLRRKEFAFKRRSKTKRKEKISAIKNFKRLRSKRLFELKKSCDLKKKKQQENCAKNRYYKQSRRPRRKRTRLLSAKKSCLQNERSNE